MDFDLSSNPVPSSSSALPAALPDAPSPIADTTYRSYDGPLHLRSARWSVIALAQWNLVRRKPVFWVLFAMGLLPYLIAGIMLYIQSNVPDAMNPRGGPKMIPWIDTNPDQKFGFQFHHALDMQMYYLFPLAILLSAGSIAADHRTNALMVYLSKPLTKGDYLLGKWLGSFFIMFGAVFAPAFALFMYCVMSGGMDFLKSDPLFLGRVVLASALPCALFTSLQVGISAWSKTPRLAGAIFAGLYLGSGWISLILWGLQTGGDLTKGVLLRHLSVSGIVNGLSQNIYHLSLNWSYLSRRSGMHSVDIPPPDWRVLLLLFVGLVAGGIAAARSRINAVEVVRG